MPIILDEVENACYNGDYKTLISLCRASEENVRYMYLEEICSPHISRGHLICANYIISCEKTEFIKERYRKHYIGRRDWALRDHMVTFRFAQRLLRIVKNFRKKKARISNILKRGF